MNKQPDQTHRISDHLGVIDVKPNPSGDAIEILYDPARLSDQEIRRIATEHIQPEASASHRYALRLDGHACEAAALKLGKRIENNVPGVRKATASYVGRILCLTFDPNVADEASLLTSVRQIGAKASLLSKPSQAAWWQRCRAGEFSEELSCFFGLAFLLAGVSAKSWTGSLLIQNGLYALAYVFCGQYGVRSAIASLREKTLDVDLLMVLAAMGAALVGAPFEGALLLFLFSFSNVLQRYAMQRTQKAIESLLRLRPETALCRRGSVLVSVRVEHLVIGDIVVLRPGELIPSDGIVVEGKSYVNEANLTGESMPVPKALGDAVFAGSLNESGSLELRIAKKAQDSTLAKMVRLVAEAQAEKSNTQRFLEKAEQRYAVAVILLTIGVFLTGWLWAGMDFKGSFYRAMTLMVVASPCALILSTPATVLSAIGGAARRGILIKGGAHLETASRVSIACFDKTGTLTVGAPGVTDILIQDGRFSIDTLTPETKSFLRLCAAIETKSEHPLAKAIVSTANATIAGALPICREFQAVPGKGAQAEVEGQILLVGSRRFLEESGAQGLEFFTNGVESLEKEGRSCVWLGRRQDDKVVVLAVFGLADTLRKEASRTINSLKRAGVKRIVMLTGDRQLVARAVANEVGIEEIKAELLPSEKMDILRVLRMQGIVMMVGDGINDAPALASADLGVAMGGAGSDVAMETADVVLMSDKLENIPLLIHIAKRTRRVLIQNLAFAASVILVLAVLALGFDLALPLGVIGHEGSTVVVCLSGLRMLICTQKVSG